MLEGYCRHRPGLLILQIRQESSIKLVILLWAPLKSCCCWLWLIFFLIFFFGGGGRIGCFGLFFVLFNFKTILMAVHFRIFHNSVLVILNHF